MASREEETKPTVVDIGNGGTDVLPPVEGGVATTPTKGPTTTTLGKLGSTLIRRASFGAMVVSAARPSEHSEAVTKQLADLDAHQTRKRNKRGSVSVFEDKVDERPSWQKRTADILDGAPCTAFMTTVTIWALFGDDFRLLCPYENEDIAFVILAIICLICFTGEIVAASLAKEKYFLGFYFWLDVVATVSLIFDIPEAYSGLTGDEQQDSSHRDRSSSSSSEGEQVDQSAALARAGRTSRAGTRAGRIVRLVRLIRILKLYKSYSQNKKKGAEQIEEEQDEVAAKQSKVGQKLSEMTTRRVIIGVLAMLFILPLFSTDTYMSLEPLYDGGLAVVARTYYNMSGGLAGPNLPLSQADNEIFMAALYSYSNQTRGMYLIVVDGVDYSNDPFGYDGTNHEVLRASEFVEAAYNNVTYSRFDIKELSELEAILNIMRTVFICIILGFGAMLFSSDANKLVLAPIERIFGKVKLMSDNPMVSFVATQAQETCKKKRPRRFSDTLKELVTGEEIGDEVELAPDEEPKEEQTYETNFLEATFTKLNRLMMVGFGAAGAEIVAENLKNGGEFDPMVPGNKMVGIFGFCDIRNFTDATEILEEGVMEFVNAIGQIVHMEVHMHGGSANKNIGDAFLLVWRFPEFVPNPEDPDNPHQVKNSEIVEMSMGRRVNDLSAAAIRKVTDHALASFVIIMSMLNKSNQLRAYRKNEKLCARMPNYSVKMGYGLHVGWAIEGAIGSKYKVDASYLSPNVNLSSRLEAATKQFGTPLLLSDALVSCLPFSTQKWVRQVDRVTVKGSNAPMGLYTIDVKPNEQEMPDPSQLPDDVRLADTKGTAKQGSMTSKQGSMTSRQGSVSKQNSKALMTPETYFSDPKVFTASNKEYADLWAEHPDLFKTRGRSLQFVERFNLAFRKYREGEWKEAKEVLLGCQEMVSPEVDGPAECLMAVMEESNFVAPADWQGFRMLTEK